MMMQNVVLGWVRFNKPIDFLVKVYCMQNSNCHCLSFDLLITSWFAKLQLIMRIITNFNSY